MSPVWSIVSAVCSLDNHRPTPLDTDRALRAGFNKPDDPHGDCSYQSRCGDGEDPGPDDAPGDSPADGGEAGGGADADNGSGDGVGCADGNACQRC